jgi:hypothetical protein
MIIYINKIVTPAQAGVQCFEIRIQNISIVIARSFATKQSSLYEFLDCRVGPSDLLAMTAAKTAAMTGAMTNS